MLRSRLQSALVSSTQVILGVYPPAVSVAASVRSGPTEQTREKSLRLAEKGSGLRLLVSSDR